MLLTFFTPATVDDSNLFLFPPKKFFFHWRMRQFIFAWVVSYYGHLFWICNYVDANPKRYTTTYPTGGELNEVYWSDRSRLQLRIITKQDDEDKAGPPQKKHKTQLLIVCRVIYLN